MRSIAESMAGYVFRGHAHSQWTLATTLDRATARWQNPRTFAKSSERNILIDFQRRAHHYTADVPETTDSLEWLALIQHYGGPTRLLDVTRSFAVAAFFAAEMADSDAAVWCLDTDALRRQASAVFPTIQVSGIYHEVNHSAITVVNDQIASPSGVSAVIPVEPFRMNPRLALQQGAFLFPTNVEQSFVENLAYAFGIPQSALDSTGNDGAVRVDSKVNLDAMCSPIVKMIVPRGQHSDLILNLEKANVSATSLFGGLDGLARSLTRSFRVFDRIFSQLQEANDDSDHE